MFYVCFCVFVYVDKTDIYILTPRKYQTDVMTLIQNWNTR